MKTKLLYLAVVAFQIFASQAGGQPAFASSPFALPEKAGVEWTYSVRAVSSDDPDDKPETGTYTMKIESVKSDARGITRLNVLEVESFIGKWRSSTWEQSEEGVTLQDTEYPGPLASESVGFGFKFLQFPWVAGHKHGNRAWVTEVKGLEEVTVPGMRGPQLAWRIYVIGTHQNHYTAVGDYWILPGWGIVKSRLTAYGWYIDTDVISVTGLAPNKRP